MPLKLHGGPMDQALCDECKRDVTGCEMVSYHGGQCCACWNERMRHHGVSAIRCDYCEEEEG